MTTPTTDCHDHERYLRWLDLDLEGELGRRESSELAQHLEACGPCRAERRQLAALSRAVGASRVPVRAGFARQIVSSLPTAAWEARHPSSWVAALAVFAVLAGAAVLLVAAGGSLGPMAGALIAVADALQASALTGAGLLAASWRGMGLAVESAFDGSALNLLAFGAGVVGLNLSFVSLLRRSRRRLRSAATTGERPVAGGG